MPNDTVPFVDAHCHVATIQNLQVESNDRKNIGSATTTRCIMTTNPFDYKNLQTYSNDDTAAPPFYKCFGIHPWYTHFFTFETNLDNLDTLAHYKSVLQYPESEEDIVLSLVKDKVLPDPIPIENYISNVNFDEVTCIGEIGLDKSFVIPTCGFYQNSKPDVRTRIKIKLEHQLRIFERMCQLADQYSLNVSIHDVNTHMMVLQSCWKIFGQNPKVSVCLHSWVGSIQFLQGEWIKKFGESRVFLSLSKYINFKRSPDGTMDYTQVPSSMLMTETDYVVDVNTDENLVKELLYIYEQLTRVLKLSSLDECKALIYDNFMRFVGS